MNLDALEDRFTVDDGDLVGGGRPATGCCTSADRSARMTVRALRRHRGAGGRRARPSSAGVRVGSPSLADDDAEHARLCDRLWGAGRVLDTDDLAAALRSGSALRPSLVVEGADLLRIGRRIGGGEVVFLANPLPEPVTVTVRRRRPGPPSPGTR